MEITNVIGYILAFAAVIICIIWAGANIMDYVDTSSIFITVGGTLFAGLASFPLKQYLGAFKNMGRAFSKPKDDLNEEIDMIINIANIARREGLLALEGAVADIDNPFLKKGIMLVVDGSDPELIKGVLEAELDYMSARHSESPAVFDMLSSTAPAFGMAGTLVGLVNMLNNLQDQSALGGQMAVALITTFYGVIMANCFFNPIARKLRILSENEVLRKELILEGLLSVQDGENPRIIKEKLIAFLAARDVRIEEDSKG